MEQKTRKRFSKFELDVEAQQLWCLATQGEVRLSPQRMKLLVRLVNSWPRVVTLAMLREDVWEGDPLVHDSAIQKAVWRLREDLKEFDDDLIETRQEVGYKLKPDVSNAPSSGSSQESPPAPQPEDAAANSEYETLRDAIVPLQNDFSRRIDAADKIKGRERLVRRIEAAIASASSGLTYWVRGEPGIGKSGLMAKFIQTNPDCLRHFIWRMGGANTPEQCLRNLYAQLVGRFMFPAMFLRPRLMDASAEELSEELPALLRYASKHFLADRPPLVIAVDGFDELEFLEARPVRHPLSFMADPPTGVAFVVSSRETLPFAVDPATQWEIRRDWHEHQEAVEQFITEKMEDPRVRGALSRSLTDPDGFIDEVQRRSQNNFMYLHFVFEELTQAGQRITDGTEEDPSAIRSLDPNQLPLGLDEYYRDHWQRLWEYRDPNISTLKALICLADVSDQKWSARLLGGVVGLPANDLANILNKDWAMFLDPIALDQLVFTFYHKTYWEFLTNDVKVRTTIESFGTSLNELYEQIKEGLFQMGRGD